ncbi:MAG: septum formation protein Maf [Gemmatimonadetes bacterium]|nr:MAG: septum formation protein Maf [Gemmatimonadota bacterium]PYO68286.1 MAG: septum formation protein Maf [Gemmatimonadota bacterium]PYP63418.1 MAG: septum formation protein Maf [Gemmatimonadota bacterium]
MSSRPPDRPIVLASGSPRRRQLLEMLRIPFRVMPPDVDEHVLPGEAPDRYVTRLSRAKAEAVVARAPGELILAADTTVVLDGAIFEKPTSPGHAVEMLSRLQGRTHEVLTAVAVARNGDLQQALDVSRVTFRAADRAMLEEYVATGEPLDKAGAYAIQGLGAPLIERVEGDFFGVMGLPLRLALDLLARFGRPYRFTR